MDVTKKRNAYPALSLLHRQRLQAMLTKLHGLPGTESSLNATEVCFYELLNTMKQYNQEGEKNSYLEELEAIRRAEHQKCQDRFVSISVRNNAVRLFKNKLVHTMASWMEE